MCRVVPLPFAVLLCLVIVYIVDLEVGAASEDLVTVHRIGVVQTSSSTYRTITRSAVGWSALRFVALAASVSHYLPRNVATHREFLSHKAVPMRSLSEST